MSSWCACRKLNDSMSTSWQDLPLHCVVLVALCGCMQPLLLRDTLQEVVVVFSDPDGNPISKCSFIVQVLTSSLACYRGASIPALQLLLWHAVLRHCFRAASSAPPAASSCCGATYDQCLCVICRALPAQHSPLTGLSWSQPSAQHC